MCTLLIFLHFAYSSPSKHYFRAVVMVVWGWVMRPLNLVPRNPEFVRQPLQTDDWPEFATKISDGRLFQRVGNELVVTNVDLRLHPRTPNFLPNPVPDPPEKWDINNLWPKNVVSEHWFASQYETTLLNQSPLALFPKQVLSKVNFYNHELLRGLVRNLRQLDDKYSPNFPEEPPFIARVRDVCADMRPLREMLTALKIRETQLQIVLLLALLPFFSSLEVLLHRHFDRLCIWQATQQENLVTDFLNTAVVPFFKVKVPQKVKEMLRINKGTLKSRSRLPAPSKPAEVEKKGEEPAVEPLSGLARALQMQNLATRTDTEIVKPAPMKRRIPKEFLADHIMSQPGFKQKSFINHLEVTLRKPSRAKVEVFEEVPEEVRGEARKEAPEEVPEEVPEVEDIMSSTDSDE